MSMEFDILAWDGKSKFAIEAVYDQYCARADFVAELLGYCKSEKLQMGATWLLKHHLENEHEISVGEMQEICALMPKQIHGAAQLHMLQIMPFIKITADEVIGLKRYLDGCIKDENKFVRAWAYNGLFELSLQYEQYRTETIILLEVALVEEAASVRARIRNIMKKLNA